MNEPCDSCHLLPAASANPVRGHVSLVGAGPGDPELLTLKAVRGSTVNGISSNPFLEHAFRTDAYTITVTKHSDGTWSYGPANAPPESGSPGSG